MKILLSGFAMGVVTLLLIRALALNSIGIYGQDYNSARDNSGYTFVLHNGGRLLETAQMCK